MALGDHQVPGVWRHLLPDDLSYMRYPSECQSTCASCPKVKEAGFHPDYRCCTYHPQIPNFLLGLALEDKATAPLIERMIADRFATPEGLQATAIQMRQALDRAVLPDFGRDHSIVCRFLDTKTRSCGVYKYRNSVCSTFFCKHDEGDRGYELWGKLQAVMGQSETGLAQWAMEQLGLNARAYFDRFDSMAVDIPAYNDPATNSWTVDALKLLWGDWYGREREFYLASAALVRENKDSLVDLVANRPLLAPKAYDQAFMAALPPNLQREMEANGLTSGEPVPVSDLWYVFKLAQRNYWRPDED